MLRASSALSRAGPRQGCLGRTTTAGIARLAPGFRRRLPEGQAECFEMGSAVMLGQDLADAASRFAGQERFKVVFGD